MPSYACPRQQLSNIEKCWLTRIKYSFTDMCCMIPSTPHRNTHTHTHAHTLSTMHRTTKPTADYEIKGRLGQRRCHCIFDQRIWRLFLRSCNITMMVCDFCFHCLVLLIEQNTPSISTKEKLLQSQWITELSQAACSLVLSHNANCRLTLVLGTTTVPLS